MRKILFLYTIALFSLLSVQAQDAGSAYKRANQQYVLFESERDKGANANSMYTYLLEAYNNFIQVTKEQNNVSYINGTKNRLRSMYPYLLNAALYYYEQKETFKALDFASAYIDIRYMPMFRSELLPKDDRYNSVVYFAAVSAFNMKKLDVAKRYFNIYLESGDSTQEKDCFVYLNMIYMSQKNYAEQENILEKAISKYPVSLDFLYNRVNVHIATNNMPKLLNTIDRILTIALQNFGTKTARNVKVNFTLPKNVYTTDSPEMLIDSIAPGEVATLDYGFLVNKRFAEDSVAVMLTAVEETQSSLINEAYKVKVGEYLTAANSIKINGKLANRKVNLQDFQLSFKSELLEGIPEGAVNNHRYALIIENEDYSMTGTNAEINVPYAVNDAMIFREYCVRTFGIPASQIKVTPNATAGMMHEQLDWLLNMAALIRMQNYSSTTPDTEIMMKLPSKLIFFLSILPEKTST